MMPRKGKDANGSQTAQHSSSPTHRPWLGHLLAEEGLDERRLSSAICTRRDQSKKGTRRKRGEGLTRRRKDVALPMRRSRAPLASATK